MKVRSVLLAVAVAVSAAQPHGHSHRHGQRRVAKREPDAAVAAVYVPGPVETVVVYELNGKTITEDEVRQGIANGTLTWGDDGFLSSSIVTVAAQATPPPAPQPQNSPQPDQDTNQNVPPLQEPQSPQSPQSSSAPAPQPQDQHQPTQGTYQPVDQDGSCSDCDKEFPNGQFSCDEFPTGYGAVHLSNEGLGGWTGIQEPKNRGAAGFDDIMTVPKGSCDDGTCCTPGSFCSYACPNPYLKQSFPKKQGATGQSVGGLYCNSDGKLEMADGSISKTLCGKGSQHFLVKVQNRLSNPVSICRTDYPGTESMTIPLTVKPGESGELANPDLSKYYFWQGNATSAQYYINKQGVPESEACTWGTGSTASGNWAPAIFGTSWDDMKANAGYPSLFQNKPTTEETLDFSVTFTGDGITNPCKFKHSSGQYCNGDNCGNADGCTASAKDGSTLTVVFSDD